METLHELRNIDVTRLLGERGYFEIGSYNKAIATVIPPILDIYSLMDIFNLLCNKLGYTEYTIIKKPTTRKELVRVMQELEVCVNE